MRGWKGPVRTVNATTELLRKLYLKKILMKKSDQILSHVISYSILLLAAGFPGSPGQATDLTLPNAGIVTVELITSDADYHNTLALASPAATVAITGCQLEPATGLTGLRLLSEKTSQHGCRVTLDANPATPGIQAFAAGTVLSFNMCAQQDATPDCEDVWSSNPALNSDGLDHVLITALHDTAFPGQIFQLAWEDFPGGGDMDYNDLIAVVRLSQDTDGDGLWDDWEQLGIDSDGDGMSDLNLAAMGAHWDRRDIFLQIDFLDCNVPGGDCGAGDTHSHQPLADAVNAVVQAFANAPVNNPDGTTGIDLHIVPGTALAHQNFVTLGCQGAPLGPGIGSFDTIKNNAFPANDPRRYVFHYCLFGHAQHPSVGWSGCGEIDGNDFMVTLVNPFNTAQIQAGSLMHELGHNLNLQHGGDVDVNYKPNYLSIMNYTFQLGGIPPTDPDGPGGAMLQAVDYSHDDLPDLVENNLNEPAGIGNGTDNTSFRCPSGVTTTQPGNGPIDWDCDGNNTQTGVSRDVNRDGLLGTLTGYNDWANLKYDFQNSRDFEDGVHTTMHTEPELDPLTYVRNFASDLVVVQTATPDPVVTGENLTYTIVVANLGPSAAAPVVVMDDLPPSTTFLSCDTSAGGVCSGTGNQRAVTFDSIPGGMAVTITLVAQVNCTLASGTPIQNTVAVATTEPELDSNNNVSTIETTAVDPPPQITCPANLVVGNDPGQCAAAVTFTPTATDNCPGFVVTCNPPSGSIFPKGTTLVTCTATDSGGNAASCDVSVTVEDREAPRVAARPAPNPSDKKIPVSGKNPSSGQNPDGYYQLLTEDNCDAAPKIFVKDEASSFIAGPFANGNIVKIIQAGTTSAKPGTPPIVAQIHLTGDALVYAVDADGNVSGSVSCKVPPPPK
jgi:uncharacterized repeat protein (TIGR01451 family)